MLGLRFCPCICGVQHQRIYWIDPNYDYGPLASLVSRADQTIRHRLDRRAVGSHGSALRFVKNQARHGISRPETIGPIPKLKLFWNGTLMRLAIGFWLSLASSSVLASLSDSAAYVLQSAKVSKITTKKGRTGILQAAFIGVLFIGFLFCSGPKFSVIRRAAGRSNSTMSSCGSRSGAGPHKRHHRRRWQRRLARRSGTKPGLCFQRGFSRQSGLAAHNVAAVERKNRFIGS